jgi:hypothetical protein
MSTAAECVNGGGYAQLYLERHTENHCFPRM